MSEQLESRILISNPKSTTQSALLEGLLTFWRTKKIRKYISGKVVLDFGCGEHLQTLRSIRSDIKKGLGCDILFGGMPPQVTEEKFKLFGSLAEIDEKIDCIISLACFEHMESNELVTILQDLRRITEKNGYIVGTVPTPPAKPILEFLSYRLRLIDSTQIRDHKVYYDKQLLSETVALSGWKVKEYRRFQFGLNSFFKLEKSGE